MHTQLPCMARLDMLQPLNPARVRAGERVVPREQGPADGRLPGLPGRGGGRLARDYAAGAAAVAAAASSASAAARRSARKQGQGRGQGDGRPRQAQMISTLELACMPWYMRAVTPKMMAVMHGRSRSLQYWCQRRITTLAAHFIVPSAQRHMAAILVERLNPACLFRLAALCAGKPPSAGKPPAGKAGKPGGKAGSAAEAPLPGEAAGPPRACVGELEAAAALWAQRWAEHAEPLTCAAAVLAPGRPALLSRCVRCCGARA